MTAGDVRVERRSVSAVGQPVRHIDWDAKTAGSAVFTGDFELPGRLLHAGSCAAHIPTPGSSVSMPTAAAAATGVAAVVTAG